MGKMEYKIAFVGLTPGIHDFEYEIDDKFFEGYEAQDLKACKAKVNLLLEKNTGFMMLNFSVGGNVVGSCDRCGNDLNVDLWDEFKLIVKMVENPEKMNSEEEDPDVFYISRTESHLELKDWLYEFVTLSVPNQKMCATDDQGNSKCNQEVLQMLEQLKVDDSASNANNIWKGLDKFKNLND